MNVEATLTRDFSEQLGDTPTNEMTMVCRADDHFFVFLEVEGQVVTDAKCTCDNDKAQRLDTTVDSAPGLDDDETYKLCRHTQAALALAYSVMGDGVTLERVD